MRFSARFDLWCITVLCGLACASALCAQTAQPITSLPKAPNDPTRNQPVTPPATPAAQPVAQPVAQPAPADAAPAYGSPANPVLATPVPAASSSSQPASGVDVPAVTAPVPPPPIQRVYTTPTATPAAGERKTPHTVRPFSTVGIGVTVGIDGIGAELAVPVASTLNVRASAAFFSYNGDFTEDGLHITGDVKLRTARMNLDWYPFHGGFRLSPGITLYNGNNVNANTNVPAGGAFSLGDQDYYSSATDPVHGTASLTFGNRTVPNFTLGWGNMVPRSGKHFSFPFEIGFEYISPPQLSFTLAGTACSTGTNSGCANIATDPQSQANLKQEEVDLNNDIAPLRFFPIFSVGFAYKF